MSKRTKVLVVATCRKTRGGITSVIKVYEGTPMWKDFHCHWCQTHRDGPSWRKMVYFVTGMTDFLVRLPFYDIVHIHTADYGAQKRKRIFAKIVKLAGKKLVVHLHSSGAEFSIEGKYKELYRETFRKADRILVLSKGWRDCVLRNYDLPPEKVTVLYNPCPKIEDRPKTEKTTEKYILFAGTLTHRKGYEDLIRAFSLIAEKIPDLKLYIAGNGEIEKGRKLASECGVAERVIFPGWVGGEDKDKLFREASIYCLPSYSEGFPMGVLDAWAYNLPVVSTLVGGLSDLAVDGENIVLSTPGNLEELSQALLRVAQDEALREKLIDAARYFSQNVFNIDKLSQQCSEIYLKL